MSGGIRRYNRPERDFLMVHRSFARLSVKQLPPRGRTVGLYILSHDHGYVQTQEDIARRLEMAVRTVAEALKDLERAGLLVRVEERNQRGHRTGTAMHVSDVPFTPEERAELLESPPAKSADAESPSAKSAGHKESNSKQESKNQEDQPSGRDVAAAPPPGVEQEDAMPKTPQNQGTLFEAPEKPRKARSAPKLPEGPAAVVAAFVDSYRQSHGGTRPLASNIAKVGNAAKMILRREEATVDQLVTCATTMGRGQWANLAQELEFARKRHGAVAASTRIALRHDDPAWEQVESTAPAADMSEADFLAAFGRSA